MSNCGGGQSDSYNCSRDWRGRVASGGRFWPIVMEVADVALYVALLGEIGIVPLAVTTGLTINFLHKPPATQQIIAVCTLLKVGRTLATGGSDSTPKASRSLLLMRLVPTRFHQSASQRQTSLAQALQCLGHLLRNLLNLLTTHHQVSDSP